MHSLLLFDSLATLSLAQIVLVLSVALFVIVWLVSNSDKVERVLGWLQAGRRAREAEVNRRLTELENANEQWLEKDAIEKRFTAVEGKHATTALEVANQHNTLMENLRERERLIGEFRNGIDQLREKVHGLETMPGRVDKLETKLDNLTTQIADLKTGQRELKQEIREDMKSNKGEILQAIKDSRS